MYVCEDTAAVQTQTHAPELPSWCLSNSGSSSDLLREGPGWQIRDIGT